MALNKTMNKDSIETIELAGFDILNTTSEKLLFLLKANHSAQQKTILFFVNTNFVVNCRAMFKQYAQYLDRVVLANDGVALNIAAKIVHGRSFIENLNGTDFSPYFLNHVDHSLNIFLLGAKPDVVKKAKCYLDSNYPTHKVVGIQDGYFDRNRNSDLIQAINESGADTLFVAMGNPIQEQWILEHHKALNVSYIFGVGALFDFWSGAKIRAPLFIQKLKLEWLFRLLQEPRRLLKRYSVDMVKFLYIVIKFSKN